MSVLINMEMPEKQTILTIFPNGYVAIYDAKESFIGETKAFPVPPHGRLIDADQFHKDNKEYWGRDFNYPQYEDTLADLVDAAPTIILAEPPKEEA